MLQTILIILGAFILYKLIFDFIIPVYRTTRRIRRQFRDIQQQMHERMRQTQPPPPPPQRQTTTKDSADYIDFEEVK